MFWYFLSDKFIHCVLYTSFKSYHSVREVSNTYIINRSIYENCCRRLNCTVYIYRHIFDFRNHCDEITTRLLKLFDKEIIFRMYAKSYNVKNLNKEIMKCSNSNIMKGQFRIPCLKYIYKFRIMIFTSLTAGCLSRGFQLPEFDPSHFSHIIIDEGASTNETTTLIRICGIVHFIIFDNIQNFLNYIY